MWSRMMAFHDLQTHLNRRSDVAGNLDRISVITSSGRLIFSLSLSLSPSLSLFLDFGRGIYAFVFGEGTNFGVWKFIQLAN